MLHDFPLSLFSRERLFSCFLKYLQMIFWIFPILLHLRNLLAYNMQFNLHFNMPFELTSVKVS